MQFLPKNVCDRHISDEKQAQMNSKLGLKYHTKIQ
jgi:hypothetical protein